MLTFTISHSAAVLSIGFCMSHVMTQLVYMEKTIAIIELSLTGKKDDVNRQYDLALYNFMIHFFVWF